MADYEATVAAREETRVSLRLGIDVGGTKFWTFANLGTFNARFNGIRPTTGVGGDTTSYAGKAVFVSDWTWAPLGKSFLQAVS